MFGNGSYYDILLRQFGISNILLFLFFYYAVFIRLKATKSQNLLAILASAAGSIFVDRIIAKIMLVPDVRVFKTFNLVDGLYLVAFLVTILANLNYSRLMRKKGLVWAIIAVSAMILFYTLLTVQPSAFFIYAFIVMAVLILDRLNKRITFRRVCGFLAVGIAWYLFFNSAPFYGIAFFAAGLFAIFGGKKYKRKYQQVCSVDEAEEAAREAGRLGEERVSNAIRDLNGYAVFDAQVFGKEHLYIRNDSGNFNEIDHLVVGENGIFHIETKSYSGSITILDNGNWVRVKRNSSEVEELNNPCDQILIHEGVLKSVLGRKYSNALHSIICFGNEYRDNYSVTGKENSQFDIVFHGDLKNYILNYNSEKRLSTEEVGEIEQLIKEHMSFDKPLASA